MKQYEVTVQLTVVDLEGGHVPFDLHERAKDAADAMAGVLSQYPSGCGFQSANTSVAAKVQSVKVRPV